MTLPQGFAAAPGDRPRPLHLVDHNGFQAWSGRQSPALQHWLAAHGFDGAAGAMLALPGDDGLGSAVLGIGDPLDPWSYAHAPGTLPPGDWHVDGDLDIEVRRALQLGWGLGAYRYTRFRDAPRTPARLVLDTLDDDITDVLAACLRVRDLVNTPTEHLGPDELEQVVRGIAERHGAAIEVVSGDDLLAQNFPAIHAVGRASHRAPRLIALRWGDPSAPHVALVGKGVCFDTGGLSIKFAEGMRNMKKDMGGAAHAIALAELIMARKLPLRITLLVPAVENSIGPNSYRPGEVVSTR
jgi:leucyl aminopeptidase